MAASAADAIAATPQARPLVAIIVATARNGAIGKGNALLWHLPGDMKHFRQATAGAPIVMGRKTWDSIGRPLPGRRNIVVTRQAGWSAPGAEAATSLTDAMMLVAQAEVVAAKVFIIGGAQIYAEALPLADELIITEVDADFEADTFFPAWDRGEFLRSSSTEPVVENDLGYRFVTYVRRREGEDTHG
jgi:dihydrofolate reductase